MSDVRRAAEVGAAYALKMNHEGADDVRIIARAGEHVSTTMSGRSSTDAEKVSAKTLLYDVLGIVVGDEWRYNERNVERAIKRLEKALGALPEPSKVEVARDAVCKAAKAWEQDEDFCLSEDYKSGEDLIDAVEALCAAEAEEGADDAQQ